MPELRRPFHQMILEAFAAMDSDFLLGAECYFAGGTRVAMVCDEFRESRDVDFLCASRLGFRRLREGVSESSLGSILRRRLPLAREVRADRDGIRTFLSMGEARVKLEIILEARIDLKGSLDRALGVPALDLECLAAEKLMANADRGLDDSTKTRDLIDLAFLAQHGGPDVIRAGMRLAETAYGAVVARHLDLVFRRLEERRGLLSANAASLGVVDLKTLRKGMARLKRLRPAKP